MIDEEKKQLFRLVRTKLGAPARKIQLEDAVLCDLFESCVQDYSSVVNNWLIETNWISLYGKSINNTDFVQAFSLKTMDMMKDYSYWFSKEVGVQQRGPWELKKDFVTIESGKQSYLIPANREINKVLYMTPSTVTPSLAASFNGGGGVDAMNGNLGQLGVANNFMGAGANGYYVMPAADLLMTATDLNLKNRIIRSDLTYKVTGGPNGTKILHLFSTPGSRLSFNYGGVGNAGYGLVNHEVWYTYYDVTDDNIDECRRLHGGDLVITPDQVPLSKMDYTYFNDPTKTIIRQLLVAEAKILLGNIRGTYSGKVSIPKAEAQLDYQMFLTQGKEEREKVMTDLTTRLNNMSPDIVLEKQAKMVDSILNIKKGVPMSMYVI